MTQQNIIQCGSFEFEWGESITEMDDSTDLLNNLPALRSKLANDGYILLRKQMSTNLIDDALEIITNSLHSTWNCIDIEDERIINDLYIKNKSTGILLTGYKPITHHKSVLSLLHCDKLINLMNNIFGSEPITYDTKWVRVKGHNECTDEHSDFYRFSDHCSNMLTVWMPLMDIPIQRGPLAVCTKSHILNYPVKNNYGDYDQKEDIELPSDFKVFNETAIWKTTNFKKGDLLIFDIRTIHASLTNKTNKFRVSVDTRWQPKHSVTFWSDSFIRFNQIKQNKNDNDDKEKKEEENNDKIDLSDIMMDCTFTESDNDIIDSLDFAQISQQTENNNTNTDKIDSRSTFV